MRKDHPLRAIRAMVDEVLSQLSRRFDTMYARVGRPSIAPEKLLRAQGNIEEISGAIRTVRRFELSVAQLQATFLKTAGSNHRDFIITADRPLPKSVCSSLRICFPESGRTLLVKCLPTNSHDRYDDPRQTG